MCLVIMFWVLSSFIFSGSSWINQVVVQDSLAALNNAFLHVKENGMSVRKAAIRFSVAETILWDRVMSKVDAQTAVMSKLPLFMQYEEARLVSYFKTMVTYGSGYTRQEMCGHCLRSVNTAWEEDWRKAAERQVDTRFPLLLARNESLKTQRSWFMLEQR